MRRNGTRTGAASEQRLVGTAGQLTMKHEADGDHEADVDHPGASTAAAERLQEDYADIPIHKEASDHRQASRIRQAIIAKLPE